MSNRLTRSTVSTGQSRREFMHTSAVLALSAGSLFRRAAAEPPPPALETPTSIGDLRVAIVACTEYGKGTREALRQAFDLIGGIGTLVRDKTVAVKVNLTGTDFSSFFGRPVGESYMTHFATALALAGLLFENGARRVRFLESTNSRGALETSVGFADWDLGALRAVGRVEFENTRNLGSSATYAMLRVPGGGAFFEAFDLNHSYTDTDVMVSLCKLKTHVTTGVTLSMKNLFGITPNALYGDQAGSEDATRGRGPLHGFSGGRGARRVNLPHLRGDATSRDPGERVPRIITDLVGARPIHLAIIDGITTLDGGEGPWVRFRGSRIVKPGVLIVGRNPVATDAVGLRVMGFANAHAAHGHPPFDRCENHLLLAERAGLGTADLSRLDVRGLALSGVQNRFLSPFESPG